MELYIIRHGECVENTNLLTLLGVEEIKNLSNILKKEGPFDVIYSSSYRQAIDSAKLIERSTKTGLIIDKRLDERYISDELKNDKEVYLNVNYEIKGKIESISSHYERVSFFMDELKQKYSGEKIIIVAHMGTTQMLLYYVLGIPIEKISSIAFSIPMGGLIKIKDSTVLSPEGWTVFI
jgi:broad specificity phosphatase PhoE